MMVLLVVIVVTRCTFKITWQDAISDLMEAKLRLTYIMPVSNLKGYF